jgi:hypothetical protein
MDVSIAGLSLSDHWSWTVEMVSPWTAGDLFGTAKPINSMEIEYSRPMPLLTGTRGRHGGRVAHARRLRVARLRRRVARRRGVPVATTQTRVIMPGVIFGQVQR